MVNQNRLSYLDALRGVAVIMVLMVHAMQFKEQLHLPSSLLNILDGGKFGVQLFFVISSFTIFYTLDNGDNRTIPFLIRRFFRIAPLYYVAVIFYTVIGNNYNNGVWANVFFVHGFSIHYINSIVPGGWSIGIEMLFYVLAPVLFKYIKNTNGALIFFMITLIGSFGLIYLVKFLRLDTASEAASYFYFWLPNQLPIFSIGIVLYFSIFKPFNNLQSVLFLLMSIALLSVLAQLSLFRVHIVVSILFAGIIWLLANSGSKFTFLINNFTLFLGKISYSIYLVQYAMMHFFKSFNLCNFFGQNIPVWKELINYVVNFFLLSIGSVAVSYLLFHLIEKPSQSMGRFLIKRIGYSK